MITGEPFSLLKYVSIFVVVGLIGAWKGEIGALPSQATRPWFRAAPIAAD